MTSSEGPFFGLASGPPKPEPTTAYSQQSKKLKSDTDSESRCGCFILKPELNRKHYEK